MALVVGVIGLHHGDFVPHSQTAIQLATERRHREVVRGAWVVMGIDGLHCGDLGHKLIQQIGG